MQREKVSEPASQWREWGRQNKNTKYEIKWLGLAVWRRRSSVNRSFNKSGRFGSDSEIRISGHLGLWRTALADRSPHQLQALCGRLPLMLTWTTDTGRLPSLKGTEKHPPEAMIQ